ncbi:MAG: type III-A CRISPR-associated protein Csm2 [Bdellovibrionota bacterium]|nr:type III-A CRISPR-associated protein Csm2 [Pseudomonadota bacterium]MDY6090378.1 type III-A CRISPR-associated protein Csm2 [Bdellovibrionota bacterium]
MSINFYKDSAKKLVDPCLFSEIAMTHAKKIFDDGNSTTIKGDNKPSQIRKFYDELVRYNDIVKVDKNKFDECLPLVHMLIPKVAYAHGRKTVTQSFVEFIGNLVKSINDAKDLSVATQFFESFVAFYKFYKPKDN